MKVSATITIDVGQFDFEDDANKKRTLKRKHNLDDWLQRHAIDINAVRKQLE